MDLADIIKVDFLLSRPTGRAAIERCLKGRQITLLAEKVETWEDFALAKELGFSLFQGYFFCQARGDDRKRSHDASNKSYGAAA